jgi:hypothetical protein
MLGALRFQGKMKKRTIKGPLWVQEWLRHKLAHLRRVESKGKTNHVSKARKRQISLMLKA